MIRYMVHGHTRSMYTAYTALTILVISQWRKMV